MAGSGWSRVPLGDFVTLQRGHDLPDSVRRPGNTPILGSFGVTGWHDEPRAAGPGVTVGRSGASLGVVSFSPVDYWPLNTALYVIDFHGNDQRFAYYFLKQFDFRSYNSGSAQPSLNRNYIHPIPIDVPPVSEQHAIAHILGTLDDKIELNRRMNETLEAMACDLFKSWFVDFDPVRAKMAGRDSGLPKPLADLFPDQLLCSDKRGIPAGWALSVLDDTIEIYSGGTPRTSVRSYWDGDIPWFTVKDAPTSSDIFVLETEKTVTQAGIENSATTILPEGTTIITARGTVGRLACTGVPMAMNQSCYGIRGKDGCPDFFTYWSIRTTLDELKKQTHGTIFDTITRQTFKHVTTTLVPIEIAQAFETTVGTVMGLMLKNLKESRTLVALRDTLLPKLISGEIRIREA